jgi:hypothetical protein
VLHAALAGAALLLLLAGLGAAVGEASALRWTSVALLAAFWSASPWLRARGAPAGRADEYERALRVLAGGQYAKLHRLALALGALAPLALLLALPGVPAALALAGVLVLAGLYLDGDLFVRAGQALPIS